MGRRKCKAWTVLVRKAGISQGGFPYFSAEACFDSYGLSYFAAEIIGNVLEIEARKWRRPRRLDKREHKDRVAKFKKRYGKYDWTGMIGS
jgi:hypothetical protein